MSGLIDETGVRSLPAERAIARRLACRIAQEALANIVKHARATEVTVTIEEKDGGLHVQIQDDGVGFAGEVPRVSARGHMGISSMRERAELQGGWCDISSLPGGGGDRAVLGSGDLGAGHRSDRRPRRGAILRRTRPGGLRPNEPHRASGELRPDRLAPGPGGHAPIA